MSENHRRQRPVTVAERWRAWMALVVMMLLICAGVFSVYYFNKKETKVVTSTPTEITTSNQTVQTKENKGVVKQFTGEQFKDLYNSFTYPNTRQISDSTPITGNEASDARIKQIAISRGYQVRSAPVSNTFQDVGGGYLLQQRAAQPWLDMQAAAKKDGLGLGLTAAYRSADEQKTLFTGRLAQTNIPFDGIATGSYDGQVSQILRTTAIPGFSRHHTGYTVDISCDNTPDSAFKNTPCFRWLSLNNYEHAKQYGWIPSYPEGTANQGPDPEAWEYVWVGVEAVTE